MASVHPLAQCLPQMEQRILIFKGSFIWSFQLSVFFSVSLFVNISLSNIFHFSFGKKNLDVSFCFFFLSQGIYLGWWVSIPSFFSDLSFQFFWRYSFYTFLPLDYPGKCVYNAQNGELFPLDNDETRPAPDQCLRLSCSIGKEEFTLEYAG